MKLVVGLGNPGVKFKNTRHNAGFLVVEKLIQNCGSKVKVLKSDKFMNESGSFVKKLLVKYPGIPVSSICVIHDDLDIMLGEYKIQFGVGPKVHNGVNSVEEALGTKDFWRVRVGVDNRDPENRIDGEAYVLQNFTDEEKKILDKVISEICKKLVTSFKNTNSTILISM